MTPRVRLFAVRLVGLVAMLGLYVSVFGTGVSDDRDPTAPAPAADFDPADTRAALADLLQPPGKVAGRFTGVVELRIRRPIVIGLDRMGPIAIQGQGLTRLIMDGPGPALHFVGTHDGTADPDSVQPKVWERQRMPLVDGLEILGNHPDACGIELTGTMQATISRVNIRGCKHAIHLTGRNRNVLLSDSHLYDNRGCGVLLDDVNLHQINITGCHISYNAGGGVVSRKGNVRNLHITGCDIESNMSPETEPTANVLIDCRESEYGTGEVAVTGCTIQHNSPARDSANIRILGRSLPSQKQELVREGNVTITGNVLSDVQVNVHLQDCRGVTLMGNTFWMGYQHNLLVEDCTNIVVGPNNLDRNPRYDYGNATTTHNAVEFRRCADGTINGLHVTQTQETSAGVQLTDCRWMNLSDLTILDCEGPALMLERCENCRVSGLLTRPHPDASELARRPLRLIDCQNIRFDGDETQALVKPL